MDTNLISFIIFSLIITITPSSEMALVTRNKISLGKKGSLYNIFGILISLTCYSILTATGLGIFLDSRNILYLAIKYLGASYLLYLGFNSLFKASKNIKSQDELNLNNNNNKNPIIQGFLTNFSNCKILVFYISVIPQFVALDEVGFAPILKLGLINTLVVTTWLYIYMLTLNKIKKQITKSSVLRKIEISTGIAMLSIGIKIFMDSE